MMAQTTMKKRKGNGEFIRRSTGDKIADAILNVSMFLMLCFILYPLLNMFSISLSNEYAVLRADVTFYPIGFNPQAYDLIFKNQDLWRSFSNSIFINISKQFIIIRNISIFQNSIIFYWDTTP